MQLSRLLLLAQEGGEAEGAGAVVVLLIELALVVLMLAGMWNAFAKAGKPGWAAIIPIYNVIVWLDIVGRPMWWIILLLIPCVNVIVLAVVCVDTAKSYGKGAGFGIGLWLLGFIFWPMLGFGDARYQGPAAAA